MRLALPLAALLLASLAAAPAASAQGAGFMSSVLTLEVAQMPMAPLRPGLDLAEVVVPWTYTFANLASAASAAGQQATLVWNEVHCDHPGVLVTGAYQETFTIPLMMTQTALSHASSFAVVTTSDAPGEVPIRCMVEGQVGQVGLSAPTNHAHGSFALVAAYDGGITAIVQERIQQGVAGSPLSFSARVTNLANSETRVTPHLVGELPAGWSVTLPESFILESARKGGLAINHTLVIEATPPRDAPAGTVLPFQVRLDAGSVRDETQQSEPVTLSFVARVSGAATDAVQAGSGGKIAPGVGPLLALGLLGLAMVVRRRSD